MNSLAHPEAVEKLLGAIRLIRWLQIASELNLEFECVVNAVGRNIFSRNIRIGKVSNKVCSCLVERHVDRTQSAEAALDG